MFNDFKQFISRGNAIDLAVGVVIGGAFGTIVTALVKDFITPLVVALVGKPNFGALTFSVHGSVFAYGDFLNAILSFFFIAAGVFFLIIKPMNYLAVLRASGKDQDPTEQQCPECLSEIPAKAVRCAFCTMELHKAHA